MKILIIKTSSMGDIIHTLPALTDAGLFFKDLRFDWVVEEDFAEIPSWHPLVDTVIPVALRRWRKQPIRTIKNAEWKKFYRALHQKQYDYVIDAQGLLKSAALLLFSRGLRCGFHFNSAREPLASFFYQKQARVLKNQHAVIRIRQLFSHALGYTLPKNRPDYGISAYRPFLTDNTDPIGTQLPSVTQIRESNSSSGAKQEKTLLFIHGTSRENKCWPESHWMTLGRLAQQAGYGIQIIWGSPEEKERSERIAASCPAARVTPPLKLTAAAKQINQATAIVAVDTGLGHLAAALGKPTVSLYGPTDPELIGTHGAKQHHLSAADKNMASLSAETVWEALIGH